MFEPFVEVKTINYIRMSYSETGPDEYRVRFEADFKPTSNIRFEIAGMTSGMDTTTTLAFLNGLMIVPTLERLNYSPKEDDTYIYEVVINNTTLIMFTVNGTEYQAEEGMTFYDWAMSEYFDSSCNLRLGITDNGNLKDDIINMNVSSDDSIPIIWYGSGVSLIPSIDTDTIIQPISYMPDNSAFDYQ